MEHRVLSPDQPGIQSEDRNDDTQATVLAEGVAVSRDEPFAPTDDARPAWLTEVPRYSAPVFVDETGRRQRRLRLFAILLCGGCTAYTILVGVGLAGGATGPQALIPLPGLVGNNAVHSAGPSKSTAPPAARTGTPGSGNRPGGGPTPSGNRRTSATAKPTAARAAGATASKPAATASQQASPQAPASPPATVPAPTPATQPTTAGTTPPPPPSQHPETTAPAQPPEPPSPTG